MVRRSLGLLILVIGCGGAEEETTSTVSDTGSASDVATEAASDTATDTASDAAIDEGTVLDAGSETAPGKCISDTTPGTHVFSCAGVGYTVTIPSTCPPAGCGLVLDVHGATMNADMEEANTLLRANATKVGYVVIQPTAPGKVPSTSWTPGVDDDKVHVVLLEAISVLGIDARRVHMTGFSQGGMMTSRFLCRWADLFASVAPAAGTGCTFLGVDKPSREVPVLYMHGTKDVLVAFSQGVMQRDAALAFWKMSGETTLASDSNFARKRWTSAAGTVFEWVQHEYKASSLAIQGHCYPGSTDKGTVSGQLFPFNCLPPNAFVWGDEVLKFFQAHPKP